MGFSNHVVKCDRALRVCKEVNNGQPYCKLQLVSQPAYRTMCAIMATLAKGRSTM
jgi:hypothetical protein